MHQEICMKNGIRTWNMQTIVNFKYNFIHFFMLLEVSYENS
jgi:hypothetical protein